MERRILDNLVVLVTGAAGGIGSAIALRAAEEGARLFITDRDHEGLQRTKERIVSIDGIANSLVGSLSNPSFAQHLIDECHAQFGALDVVVNNAGIGHRASVAEHSLEAWNKVIHVNLTMPFLIVQKAIPMLAQSNSAAIVNIASTAIAGFGGQVAYDSSKGGILSMTRSMAVDLSDIHIRANAVCPGFVDTDMVATDAEFKNMAEIYCKRLPIPRLAKAVEIAAAVVWLASPESSYVNGQGIFVDGGWIRS